MHEDAQKAEFDLLMQSQFWPADRIRDLQRERLEVLLRHARAHVPFYATRLDPLFRPDGTIAWNRWQDVPTVKRSDLIAHRRAMLARSVPRGHEDITDMSSSGSTGSPITTSHSGLSLQLSKAAVLRASVNDGVDFGARLGAWNGEDARVSTWPEGRATGRWGPWWDDDAAVGRAFEISHTVPPERALEFMVRSDVRYMMMGGTDARLLAHEARRLGVDLRVEAIFTRGTDPTEAGTALVAEVFGARTLPLYSSREGHRMAHRCPVCGHWHVNDEQVLLEILDDDDRPVAPGETGRVVITPFRGFAQPLIRYEQGDLAVRGAPAACGRGLGVIESIVGRVRHMFVMPDGSRIVPTLTVAAVDALNAAMFQVAQVALDQVEVRYVALQNDRTPDPSAAGAELASILHPAIRTTFRQIDAFATPAGRKHIEFVCEVPGA
jgi:phenylacetate-CoA ligase